MIRCKVDTGSLVGELVLRDALAPARRVVKGEPCSDARSVAQVAGTLVGDRFREHVIAVGFDARHRIVRACVVSVGSLMSSIVSPREVLRAMLGRADEEPAAAFALVHNHPSGDPTPSVEDHQVTTRMQEAARVVGIRMVDHVVIAWQQGVPTRRYDEVVAPDSLGWKSFADEGWLRND